MDEKIFNRIEKKYLISGKQHRTLLKSIQKYMQKDGYFKSEVLNIYFDTSNYDLIIQSIDHPIFKEKLRARSYGGYDKVFLEIKTKLLGKDANLGYKRRILITHQDFADLISGKATILKLASRNIETSADLQIAKEVQYMMKHFNLQPKILVYYDRESYVDDNGLRITFDRNLKYRHQDLTFHKKSSDLNYFKNNGKNVIMEIKTTIAMPLWLVQILSSEHIYPERFSKIGRIYEKIYNG